MAAALALVLAAVGVALYFALRKKEGFDASPSLFDLKEFSSLKPEPMEFAAGVMSTYMPTLLQEFNVLFDKLSPAERKEMLKNAPAAGAVVAKPIAADLRRSFDIILKVKQQRKKQGK